MTSRRRDSKDASKVGYKGCASSRSGSILYSRFQTRSEVALESTGEGDFVLGAHRLVAGHVSEERARQEPASERASACVRMCAS
jgi:hypothetical protein